MILYIIWKGEGESKWDIG
jgi:hypothetical protein